MKRGATATCGCEAEARPAGATRLTITSHAIINRRLMSEGLARRYGFTFRQINAEIIELTKANSR